MNAAKTADHVDCTCRHCGAEFRISPVRRAQGGGVYCSKSCKDTARRAVLRDCAVCETPFAPPAARSALPKVYCSKACSGLDHRKRVACTCERCGGQFEVRQSRVDSGRGVYCSKACQFLGPVDRNCERCGSHFTADRSELAKGWGRFCSNQCRRTRREHMCRTCGVVFEVELAKLNKGIGVYCSVDCRGLGMRSRVKRQCQTCEKEFERPASAVARSAALFCSRACNTEARRNDPAEVERVRQMQRDHLASRDPTRCESALYLLMDRVFGEGNWASQFLVFDKWTVDACVPNINLVVQADGEYWHGHDPDVRNHPMVAKNMLNDLNQKKYLEKAGWALERFWEFDLLKDPDICEARLIQIRDLAMGSPNS